MGPTLPFRLAFRPLQALYVILANTLTWLTKVQSVGMLLTVIMITWLNFLAVSTLPCIRRAGWSVAREIAQA